PVPEAARQRPPQDAAQDPVQLPLPVGEAGVQLRQAVGPVLGAEARGQADLEVGVRPEFLQTVNRLHDAHRCPSPARAEWASRTAAQTASPWAPVSSGYIGRESTSRAARSAWGNAPGR